MKRKAAILCLSIAVFSQPLFAGVIAYFNTGDLAYGPVNGVYLAEPPPWSHDPTVVVGNLTRHGSVTGNEYYEMGYTGWTTTQNPANYVSFTVAPKSGETLTLTSFQFDFSPFRHPATVTYNWAYRIDAGAGFGGWVYAPAFTGNTSRQIWEFPAPIVTTGTVEFAFFASAPTTDQLVSPAFPTVMGTAGDTSPDPSLHGVISGYQRVITYQGELEKESSAITYSWDTDTLYVVDDEGREIKEISKMGKDLSSMAMTQLSFPPQGYKGDPEGLTYIGKDADGLGEFIIGAERQNVAIKLKYRRNSDDTPKWMRTPPLVTFGHTNGNVGLEGVAYDYSDGSLWGIKERLTVSILRATNPGTPQQTLTAIDMNDINWRLGLTSISDIYVMANSAAYADSDHLLVLARDQRKIVEITKTGLVVDTLDISKIGRSTIEGITMDDDGVIYLCSEGGGGSYAYFFGGLHVLTAPKNRVVGTGGRGVLVGTSGPDELTGNPASDTLTGGAGADNFVFSSMRDGVDTITDFTPGEDIIDVGDLLTSIGYAGVPYSYNPLKDGAMRVLDGASGAVVQVRVSGSYRSLIILPGLTAAQAGVETNFRFITSKLGN